jgi:hypothetical protein
MPSAMSYGADTSRRWSGADRGPMNRRAHSAVEGGRRLVLFGLGVGVVLDAIVTSGTHVAELWAGLALLGLVPLDAFLGRLPRR